MGFARRVQLTWLAIRYSLRPPAAPPGRPAGAAGLPRASAPLRRLLLTDLDRHLDRHGCLRLILPGVYPLAAPAILFRLKRSGWSACRVTVTATGLVLTARR